MSKLDHILSRYMVGIMVNIGHGTARHALDCFVLVMLAHLKGIDIHVESRYTKLYYLAVLGVEAYRKKKQTWVGYNME